MNLRLPAGYVEGKAAQAQAEARESFWAFRKNLRYGTMLSGWWVELAAVELQQFYQDFVAGRRPRRALMAPPQHGKSLTGVDFIAWTSGRIPISRRSSHRTQPTWVYAPIWSCSAFFRASATSGFFR
jgi:hypothetical protein